MKRLVGRVDELSALLAQCAADEPGAVLVVGEAGVGKTRLLDELVDRLRPAGATVLRGRAVEGGGPFRPLVQALLPVVETNMAGSPELRSHAPVLARLFPGWPTPPAPTPYLVDPVVVLGEAVRALLRVIAAARQRVVVVLDDLHWADRDTLDLLGYLADAPPPVPLVLAARDDEQARRDKRMESGLALLGRLAVRVPLGRLEDGQVAAVAAQRAGGPLDPLALAYVAAASDRLALLVCELTDGLVESGALRRDGTVWRVDGELRARVPQTFAGLVTVRMRSLAEPARQLVRTAALMGDELDWSFVATAFAVADPAADLRAAVEAGLFRTGDAERLQWRHALTRQAVLDELTPPESAELTRRVASRLASESLSGAQLAVAADLCARAGNRSRAAEMMLDLGREHIVANALGRAAEVLESAAVLAEGAPGGLSGSATREVAGDIAAERVKVLGLQARIDEALEVGSRLPMGLPADREARVRLQLARACVAAERWDDAAQHLRAVEVTATAGAEVLALAAHVALGLRDPHGALRLADQAIAAGRGDGAPEAVCEALEILGRVHRSSDPAASGAAFAEGARLASEHGLVQWQVRALSELATNDLFSASGLARLREARRLATDAGMPGWAVMLDLQMLAAGVMVDGYAATLPIARRCAEAATRLRLPGPAAHALVFVCRGRFWCGDTAGATETVEEYLRTSPNPVAATSARASIAAWDAWASHDAERAVRLLSQMMDALRAAPVSIPAPIWGQWALLSTVANPDDPAPLEELRSSDVLVQIANRAALHYGDAVLAARAGQHGRSRELVEEADVMLAHCTHERLFQRSLMIGSTGAAAAFDAEVALREALTRWEPAGETRLVRWCRDRLRMLGLPVPRAGRDRTAVPPSLRALGVTGREFEVLQLVVEGVTNAEAAARLNVSPRTVETHVSNLLAKTGAVARAGLAAWLPSLAP